MVTFSWWSTNIVSSRWGSCRCDGSIFLLNKFLNAPKSERPWHYVALMAEYLLQWLEQLLLLLILLLISASFICAFVDSYHIDEFNFTTPIPRICPHCIFCCSYDDFIITVATAEAGNIIRNLTLGGRISKFCNMR